jgi:integrase
VGLKYETEAKTLGQFTRYCEKEYPDSVLPEDVIPRWIYSDSNQSLRTKYGKNCVLKNWAQYLFSLGYKPLKIPLIRFSQNTGFVPHIFTADEINAIWNTVDHIRPYKPSGNLHNCIPVLFRLLYASGLRISEALQLNVEDIDFSSNVITVHRAKLDRERLIPMLDSLASVLKKYAREHTSDLGKTDPFFFYRKGVRLTQSPIYSRFRKTLQDSGIPYQGKTRGPRIHDFRHTFAVNAMNKLVDEEGKDLYVILPILSAYLGHSSVAGTERYVRLTGERLSTITDSVEKILPNIFPEVDDDAEI